MQTSEVERFPPYDDYLDGDLWPAYDGSSVGLTWVRDMAPQHCTSAIYKLKRWAFTQWSDEMRNEAGWQEIRKSTLFKHLACMAIDEDYAFLSAKQPKYVQIDDRAYIHALEGAVHQAIQTGMDERERYVLAALMYAHLTDNKMYLTKKVT